MYEYSNFMKINTQAKMMFLPLAQVKELLI